MWRVWVRTVLWETNRARAISGAGEVAVEQPEHLHLAFAQRVDEHLAGCRSPVRGKDALGVPVSESHSLCVEQQGAHGLALGEE